MDEVWAKRRLHIGLIKTTRKKRNHAKTSLEELLCSLIKSGNKDVHDEFRKCNVIAVCQTHQLKDLATLISGGNRQPKGKDS